MYSLKNKKLMLSTWNCEDKNSWPYKNNYLILKDLFKNVILFDPRKKRFELGSKEMLRKFLSTIKEKKPDFLMLMVGSKELNIDTIEKINRISPKTKIIVDFGDDDIDFDIFSRYYALFIDYYLVGQPQYLSKYKKEGLKNAFTRLATNIEHYKPLNLKKEYDVSFIGTPLPSRVENLNYLIKKGIDVKLFGKNWDSYRELSKIYKGKVSNKEALRIRNQTRVNLCFSRNKYGEPHFVLRAFNIAACKAFQIIDYFSEYKKYFDKDEIVMFKDKNDMVKKIKYYLKNEKLRESIAERAYKKVIKKYTMKKVFINLFNSILKEEKKFKRNNFPKINKKIVTLKNKDLIDDNKLRKKIKNSDYITFLVDGSEEKSNKNYLQVYGLEKTGKEISCCDYSITVKGIEEIMTIKTFRALKNLKKSDFDNLLSLSQIVVSKKFFTNNIKIFKEAFDGGKINIINEKSTAFVSIPLVNFNEINKRIKNTLNNLTNNDIEKAYQLDFAVELFSLIKRKSIFNSYMYKLLVNSLVKKKFIIKYLVRSLFNREKLKRIKR